MSKAVPTTIRLPIVLRALEVVGVTDISPKMRRVTLAGPQLQSFSKDGFDLPAFRSEGPDDHVKLLLPNPKTGDLYLPKQAEGVLDWSGEGRPTGRSYTPRAYDPASGRLQIDFVLHGHGPAGLWAANAKIGDTLHMAGPKSSLLIPVEADWFVLAGDETALPAIANWLEALPTKARVAAFIQVSDASARIPIKAPKGAIIEWIVDPSLRSETLTEALRRFAWWDGDGFVWAASERESAKLLRKYLIEERGHDRRALDVVAYWHKGVEDEALERTHDRLHQLTDLLAPHAVRVATTLRLPDLIANGATTLEALAEGSGASLSGLAQLVPVLIDYGILEGQTGALKLGLMGQMLREDQHDFDHFDLNGPHGRIDLAWAGLYRAVLDGGEGYGSVFGQPFWQDMAANPDLAAAMDEERAEWADYWSGPVAKYIAVPAQGTVSDVGGGAGVLLAAILRQNPEARGLLVELPTAIAAGQSTFERARLSDRVSLHTGSFFNSLPSAEVQVLAQVLRHWPDAEAALIFKRVSEAVGEAGTVYVVERHHDPLAGKTNAEASLQMFVLSGGRERTGDELDALAAKAGLVRQSAHLAGPGLLVYRYHRNT